MGRVATYGVLGLIVILWIVFIPMAIGEMINCPRINSQMRADYTSNEIADATIGPGRSLSGVMYVAPFKSGTAFTIPLINRDTSERLLFQFQYNQSAPANIQTIQSTNIQTTQPKQNISAADKQKLEQIRGKNKMEVEAMLGKPTIEYTPDKQGNAIREYSLNGRTVQVYFKKDIAQGYGM